jgi:hypothetical protein
VEVVTDGRKCSRKIAVSFIVVVTISEAQNPTKVMHMSSLSCARHNSLVKNSMIKIPRPLSCKIKELVKDKPNHHISYK